MWLKNCCILILALICSSSLVVAQQLEIDLIMPGIVFGPGSLFFLDLSITNNGQTMNGIQVYVVFSLGAGDFYFYPSWVRFPQGIDWRLINIPEYSHQVIPIINKVEWPFGAGEFNDAVFYAAMIDNEDMVSNLSEAVFSWSNSRVATPTATMTVSPTATPIPPVVPDQFIYIPAGEFSMGHQVGEYCSGNNEFLHPVTLTTGYYILATEITQAQWKSMFGSNPSETVGEDHPVENVTWFDACLYCNKLSTLQGLTPGYYSDLDCTRIFDGEDFEL